MGGCIAVAGDCSCRQVGASSLRMRVRRVFVRVYPGLEGLDFGFVLGFVAFGTDAAADATSARVST